MANCFHIVSREGKQYLFKRIPLTVSVKKGTALIRGREFFLEDILSSKSSEIDKLIKYPDGYYVKRNRHYEDNALMEKSISLDHIFLNPVGGRSEEKYHLDIGEEQSDRAYIMYCPGKSSEYKGEKLFILDPEREKEIKIPGGIMKIAHKDGKIFLNGGQGIDVHYDHTWPSRVKVFA